MRKYLSGGTFVLVEWIDAFGAGGWNEVDAIRANPREARIRTAGWVVADDEDYLTVTMQYQLTEPACGAVASIPQSCIQKVTRLGKKYWAEELE